MIPAAAVTAWAVGRAWPTPEQVEQDLLLSRAICEIEQHPYLGEELAFRGGTALHKLHLSTPLRYSEDLDYVRTTAGGIAERTHALSALGASLGFVVSTRVTTHPKVYWKTTAATGVPLRIKIEVNTHERSPAIPHTTVTHSVASAWWTGSALVKTFQRAELVATKDPRPVSTQQRPRPLRPVAGAHRTWHRTDGHSCGVQSLPPAGFHRHGGHRQPAEQARAIGLPSRPRSAGAQLA